MWSRSVGEQPGCSRHPAGQHAVRQTAPTGSVSWLVAVAILVLLAAALVYWRSDTWRLERRLTRIEHLLSKDDAEEPLAAAAKSRQLVTFFATGFVIRAHPYDAVLADPDELAAAIHNYRSASGWIRASLHERDIDIAGQPPTATVRFTATLDRHVAGREARERYHLSSRWLKHEDEWLIQEVDVLEVEVSPHHPLTSLGS